MSLEPRFWHLRPLLRRLLVLACLLLAGCEGSGSTLLSDISATDGQLQVNGQRETRTTVNAIDFGYSLARTASLESYLEGRTQRFLVRPTQERAVGSYQYHFDGVLPTGGAGGVVAQAVPVGSYRLAVTATAGSEVLVRRSPEFQVVASDTEPPRFERFSAPVPAVVSPNNDAISDTLPLNYRISKDARVIGYATDLSGTRTIFQPATRVLSGENTLYFTGKQLAGDAPLAGGSYTLTVRATDSAGNISEQNLLAHVEGGGTAAAQIVKVEIGPPDIIRGDVNGGVITVSITVKNTGTTTLNTQAPDPGYEYTTNDSYASVGKADQPGLWRVGLDWNNNRGGDGAAYRYPYRWGFGKPLLAGETVTVVGRVRVLKQEEFMTFYAAILQEGVQIINDRAGATVIHVH